METRTLEGGEQGGHSRSTLVRVVRGAASDGPRTPWWTPYLISIALGVVAIALWGYSIAFVADRWDGDSACCREDVVAYFAAGQLLRDGRSADMYDAEATAKAEEAILGRPAGKFGGLVYMNPPLVAGMFVPLTYLPYGKAQAVWFAIGTLAIMASLALLWPELRKLQRRWAVVFVLAALASFPVSWSLSYGQVSPLILLSWVLFYRMLKDGHEMPAGLALALCLIKPHLALVPALYLLATRRWLALGAFVAGFAALVGVSVALVGSDVMFGAYPRFLLGSLKWQDEYGVDRDHMFGWLSFLQMVIPGMSRTTLLAVTGVASVLTLGAAAYVWLCERRLEVAAPLLAAASATILISPHLHTQDLQILILPAVLLVAHRRDVSAIVIPALLFFVMPIAIGINLATPYLALTLLVLAARAAGLRFDTALASVGLRRILQPVPLALPAPVRSATETQR